MSRSQTKLFKQADVDGEGKLETKELRTKAGKGAFALDPVSPRFLNLYPSMEAVGSS